MPSVVPPAVTAVSAEERATRWEALAASRQTVMNERRNIGLRIYFGYVVFNLFLLRGSTEVVPHMKSLLLLRVLVAMAGFISLAIVGGMLRQIELSNRRDRQAYRWYHESALELARGHEPPPEPAVESWWESIQKSWASTWPLLGGILLSVVVLLFALNLKR